MKNLAKIGLGIAIVASIGFASSAMAFPHNNGYHNNSHYGYQHQNVEPNNAHHMAKRTSCHNAYYQEQNIPQHMHGQRMHRMNGMHNQRGFCANMQRHNIVAPQQHQQHYRHNMSGVAPKQNNLVQSNNNDVV